MKKIVSAVFAAVVSLLLLSGCGGREESAKIVCTAFPQYDFVRNIAGEEDVTLLADNGADLHSYEMTPKDIVAISKADILITVGGESDEWATEAAKSSESKAEIVDICSFCDLLSVHDEHDEFDEHVWLSPKNAIKITEGLCETLCAAYPEKAEEYRANAEKYVEKLNALDEKFLSLPKGKMIVADRFPFAYLAADYGFEYTAAFEGCSAESEASFAKMAELVTSAEEVGAKYVFKTDNSTLGIAEKVAESVGANVETLYSLQATSDGETYISAMEKNYENLKKAFE